LSERSASRARGAPDGFAFWIHVSPRARREAVGGRHGDALRVAVRAAPEAGRANAACVAALAEAFGVGRSDVALDPRSTGRRKRVRIGGDASLLERRFEALAEGS
jgi:uncharacterized protein (TIGR00251 family)